MNPGHLSYSDADLYHLLLTKTRIRSLRGRLSERCASAANLRRVNDSRDGRRHSNETGKMRSLLFDENSLIQTNNSLFTFQISLFC